MTITVKTQPTDVGGEYRLHTEEGTPSVYVLSGSWYEAQGEDERGERYRIYWTIRDGYNAAEDDEDDACDWANPVAVETDAARRVLVTGCTIRW